MFLTDAGDGDATPGLGQRALDESRRQPLSGPPIDLEGRQVGRDSDQPGDRFGRAGLERELLRLGHQQVELLAEHRQAALGQAAVRTVDGHRQVVSMGDHRHHVADARRRVAPEARPGNEHGQAGEVGHAGIEDRELQRLRAGVVDLGGDLQGGRGRLQTEGLGDLHVQGREQPRRLEDPLQIGERHVRPGRPDHRRPAVAPVGHDLDGLGPEQTRQIAQGEQVVDGVPVRLPLGPDDVRVDHRTGLGDVEVALAQPPDHEARPVVVQQVVPGTGFPGRAPDEGARVPLGQHAGPGLVRAQALAQIHLGDRLEDRRVPVDGAAEQQQQQQDTQGSQGTPPVRTQPCHTLGWDQHDRRGSTPPGHPICSPPGRPEEPRRRRCPIP